MPELTEKLLAELRSLDTPTVCNALQVVVPGRRGYGYTTQGLICLRPGLPPIVGVARTASIRAAHPPDLAAGDAAKFAQTYYAYIDEGPKPSIVVMQDLDGAQRGYGSFWGEVNSNIHRGFGAVGLITDGSVRDLPDIAEGFQVLADRVGPSRANVHVVDFGRTVTVAGMRVSDGDLIHADQHGAVVIPFDAAARLKDAADLIVRKERTVIEASRQPGFNMDRLRKAWADADDIH